jgi:RNA polymerase sigma-70 factor (ECF subfamily)
MGLRSRLSDPVSGVDNRPSDAELVTSSRRGNLGAKEELFLRYLEMASGLAYRLMGSDAELEDIVQESFTAAFASLHKLEKPQAFAAWFSAIVTGTSIAVLRRRRLLSRLGLRPRQPIALDSLVGPSVPQDLAVELRTLYGAIDALPPDERVILILRRVEHLGLEEIAQQTGWSLATVKRRLARATARLERAAGRTEKGR